MTPSSALLRICAPMLIWAAHFFAIYGATAIACERGYAAARVLEIGVVAWVVGIATLIAAAAAAMTIRAAVRRCGRDGDATAAFVDWVGAAAGCLVLLAILWEALPVLLVPACP